MRLLVFCLAFAILLSNYANLCVCYFCNQKKQINFPLMPPNWFFRKNWKSPSLFMPMHRVNITLTNKTVLQITKHTFHSLASFSLTLSVFHSHRSLIADRFIWILIRSASIRTLSHYFFHHSDSLRAHTTDKFNENNYCKNKMLAGFLRIKL